MRFKQVLYNTKLSVSLFYICHIVKKDYICILKKERKKRKRN